MPLDDILKDLDSQKQRIQSNLDKLQEKQEKQEKQPIPLTHRRQDNNKRLTDVEQLLIAASKIESPDKTYREIANENGISVSTAYQYCNDDKLKTKLTTAEHIKKALSADLYITAQRSLDAITDDRLQKVNAYQNAIITATCIDKARLIEGQSTHNISLAGRFMMLQEQAEKAD